MTAAAIFGQALFGWLLADLLTGAFHWWEDNYGSEAWPIVGPWLIEPNRLHHAEPLAFTRHGFWARNLASIAAATAGAALLAVLTGPAVWIGTLAIGGALSNEVHYYAHRPSVAGPVLRVLQQTGLCQSPKGHAVHHRPLHSAAYCVLTDWLNPTLEALRIWQRLDRLFGRGPR